MSCPDFVTSHAGRRGIGVIQPQSGLDYPLIAPSEDIQYLIADFYLSFDDIEEYRGNGASKPPYYIAALYGVGCVDNTPPAGFLTPQHLADIVVKDSNGRIVFDSSASFFGTDFTKREWSADYDIYTWKTQLGFCRLVVHTTWPIAVDETDDDARRQYNKYLVPQNAELDARTVYRMPKRLLGIRVQNGTSISGWSRGKHVVLSNGYNTTLTAADKTVTDFRGNTNITLAAVPGSGAGKFVDCTDIEATKPITQINTSGANSYGDFLLAAGGCLWARRPTVVLERDAQNKPTSLQPLPGVGQQIGADCKPCCSCQDYADTAKYMNETSFRYSLIGQRAEQIRSYHSDNVTRWNDQRVCSLQRPLRLIMVAQRCPYVDVIMQVCNPCESCLGASRLTLDVSVGNLSGDPTSDVLVSQECGYTAMYAPNVNGKAVGLTSETTETGFRYSVAFPQLRAGESAYVTFRLKFMLPDTEAPAEEQPAFKRPNGPYPITGVLTGPMLATNSPLLNNCGNADATPAEATYTQTLYCNEDGTTELPC